MKFLERLFRPQKYYIKVARQAQPIDPRTSHLDRVKLSAKDLAEFRKVVIK